MATGRLGAAPVLKTRWTKEPSAGTTSLSGLDANSVSLVYSVGYEQVYRNGVLLSRGNDYTATDGTTITLTDATVAGDIVEVFANELIPLSDAIGKGQYNGKGALVSASAASTPATLAVGNNGDTLVADSSQSTGLRYNPPVASLANPVINGGFDIWQRGTSIATGTAFTYSADRWQSNRGSLVAGMTVSRQVTGDTTNLPNIQYAARVQRDSGNTSTQPIYFYQSFETVNSIPFAGKTVTLSFYARAGANYSSSSSALSVNFRSGTGTDQNINGGYTGQANVVAQTATLTTTWQRFAYTGTIGATATELSTEFAFTPVGTAGANDWFEVTGVQIDVGTWTASTAPTFRRSGGTLAGELAACQRYYQVLTDGNAQNIVNCAAFNTTEAYGVHRMPVEMRTAPTLSQVTGTNYFRMNGNQSTLDYFNGFNAISDTSTRAVRFDVNANIAVTTGYAYWISTNNAAAVVALSAEL